MRQDPIRTEVTQIAEARTKTGVIHTVIKVAHTKTKARTRIEEVKVEEVTEGTATTDDHNKEDMETTAKQASGDQRRRRMYSVNAVD